MPFSPNLGSRRSVANPFPLGVHLTKSVPTRRLVTQSCVYAAKSSEVIAFSIGDLEMDILFTGLVSRGPLIGTGLLRLRDFTWPLLLLPPRGASIFSPAGARGLVRVEESCTDVGARCDRGLETQDRVPGALYILGKYFDK